jgi:hypothetical protein
MGGKPDGIHPQVDQVIEFCRDPLQVADPIPIPICEAARVNLVENGRLPPF